MILFCTNAEIITCPALMNPNNGVITFTPGADNSNIGLGSVVSYSCNLGYVLVGQTTRVCQSSGTTGVWSGSQPTCEGKLASNKVGMLFLVQIDDRPQKTEAVYCPALTPPENGRVSTSSGVNHLGVGSTATYSCNPGYALLTIGSTTRTCEDPDRDSVGTWTGSMPSCQGI